MLECRHTVLYQEIHDQIRPVCWSIVLKKTPVVGSSFLGAFPSDRIAKVTNQLTRKKLPQCSNYCEIYQRIPEKFRSYFVFIHDIISLATDSLLAAL